MIKNIVAAFQFLTVLPLPVKTDMDNLNRSIVWYPLTGSVIGLLCAAGVIGFNKILPAAPAVVLSILFYVVLTRGLHLDGMMDAIDGFFSGRQRERILEIMKEPTVGSFAVAGMAVWVLLLFSCMPLLQPLDFVFVHMSTRFGVLLPALFFTYPRESGTGRFFVENVNIKTVLAASVSLAAVTATAYFSFPDMGKRLWVYGICLLVAAVTALICGVWANKKINGITGDLLGFVIECSHAALVLVIVCCDYLTG